MHRNSTIVSTKQERIAALAKQSPQMAFTSLAYLMDIDWLKEAYQRTRKDGAAGVDGVSAEEYEQHVTQELGTREDAITAYQQAREIFATLVREHPEVPEHRAELARSY